MIELIAVLILAQSSPNSSQVKYQACMREVQTKTQSCLQTASKIATPGEPKYKSYVDSCLSQVRQYQETRCDPLLFEKR